MVADAKAYQDEDTQSAPMVQEEWVPALRVTTEEQLPPRKKDDEIQAPRVQAEPDETLKQQARCRNESIVGYND